MTITQKTLGLSILLFSILSHSSHAHLFQNISNDPEGKLFIKKSAGDISNCGPIAALMARKFSTHQFSVSNLNQSISKARYTVKPVLNQNDDEEHGITNFDSRSSSSDSSWWRTSDIKAYFNKNAVKHYSINLTHSTTQSEQALINELNKGNIMIVNLNMNDMPHSFGKVGKPYFTFPIPGGWGHYLVVVGYKQVNNTLVFETHDSFSKSGKNRMFKASNLVRAVKRYNPQVVVVQK